MAASIQRLRIQSVALLLASLSASGALALVLASAWEIRFALRWLGLAGFAAAVLFWVLWRNLHENRRPGEDILLPWLGAANLLTCLRGLGIAWLAGFLFLPRPAGWLAWLPGVLYLMVVLADLFDGYLARRTSTPTRLGELLDLHLDGMGVLTGAVLLYQYGQVPAWYLLVGLARYLFLGGIWLRTRLTWPVYELPLSASRRPLAGAQMGFIAVLLLPLFTPPATTLAAALFGLPFLGGFARDWLAVCGVIQPGSTEKALLGMGMPRLRRAARTGLAWLPLALRVLVVFNLVSLLAAQIESLAVTSSIRQMIAGAQDYPLVYALVLVELLAAGLLALGAAGRFASLAVLFSLGIYLQTSSLSPLVLGAAVTATLLFFLGTGSYSLWNPEQPLISKRLGEV